jgi:PAS domain S-box-containing protein
VVPSDRLAIENLALTRTVAVLRATLEAADEAILVTNADGRVAHFNSRFLQLWNLSDADVAGRPTDVLFPAIYERADLSAECANRLVGLGVSETELRDELTLDDGRTVVCVSRPQWIDGSYDGRVWCFRDVTQGYKAEQLQSQLAAIIESSDDAIVSKTLQGIIRTWNLGAERMFGYTAEEVVGRSVTMLFPPDRINEEDLILGRIQRGDRVDHFETVRLRKDGTPLEVSLTISPVRDAAGNITGASKIARDITARKQLEKEREELLASERSARTAAERASLVKDEFLSTLSHELRTPLTAILGWSQLLGIGNAEPDILSKGLEAIERNARVQTQIIDDLLDMSRILSGKLRLDVQTLDITAVVEAAIESIRPAAEAKSLRLRKIIDPLAGPVLGDPTRLQQVLWNLLTNAVKFTPKEGRIDVLLERVNSHLELTVQDSGMGIKPEFLPLVFERFRQADSSTTRSYGGLGLGLSLVKSLVELHGGTVRAKSPGEGQGAAFIVSLPVSPVRQGEKREHPTTPRAPVLDYGMVDLKGLRVLIVDDEADSREFLKRLLVECHVDVHLAGSAKEGLQRVIEIRPDVLISDIGMPEVDGYQFIREIRRLPADEGGRTPAIALTAFARSEDRTRAIIAGYQSHIAKPLEPQELIANLAGLSGRVGSS